MHMPASICFHTFVQVQEFSMSGADLVTSLPSYTTLSVQAEKLSASTISKSWSIFLWRTWRKMGKVRPSRREKSSWSRGMDDWVILRKVNCRHLCPCSLLTIMCRPLWRDSCWRSGAHCTQSFNWPTRKPRADVHSRRKLHAVYWANRQRCRG